MRYFLLLIGTFCMLPLFGQVTKDAAGLRMGGGDDSFGVELSYQYRIKDASRVEFSAGFGYNDDYQLASIVPTFQGVWNIRGGWNWYFGGGIGMYYASYHRDLMKTIEQPFNVGLAAQIGIEFGLYQKSLPLLVSLDTRPVWRIIGEIEGYEMIAALSIRYTFTRSFVRE